MLMGHSASIWSGALRDLWTSSKGVCCVCVHVICADMW